MLIVENILPIFRDFKALPNDVEHMFMSNNDDGTCTYMYYTSIGTFQLRMTNDVVENMCPNGRGRSDLIKYERFLTEFRKALAEKIMDIE